MQPGDVSITYADTTPLERDYGFNQGLLLKETLENLVSGIKSSISTLFILG